MSTNQPIPDWFASMAWAGKVRSTPFTPLTNDEIALFDRDFAVLVEYLTKHDAEIARNFAAKAEYYKVAAGIFKGTFNLPFGGLETSSGEFGFSAPIPSYPFLAANNWVKTVTAGWNNLFGSSSSGIAGNSTVTTRRMYAYHGLLSVGGDPKLSGYAFNINGYDYPVQNPLFQIKLPKKDTWVRAIPFLKNVIVHPTGTHYLRAAFEQAGQVELIPLGVMFAEHDYLTAEGSFYT